MPLRVLVAASECAPLMKIGGLGDVVGALPAALRREGIDARLLLPGYRPVLAAVGEGASAVALPPLGELPSARVLAGEGPGGVPLYAVDCPQLYAREGSPYVDADGRDWPDNALRFALLAHAAASFGRTGAPHGWTCDVVHANDWQAGLAPAYLALGAAPRAASLFTIHNLAFQGIFGHDWLRRLGLPDAAWSLHGVEYHGRMSFMKAGLYYAGAISTVSPTYAREICTAPLGMGFEGLLAGRTADLVGILNGIDERTWNPRSDPMIASRYGAGELARKAANRTALAQRVGLAPGVDGPLFGMVSRLSPQKGIDLVLDVAERLAALPAQLVVVGSGDRDLEARMRDCAKRLRGRVATVVGYDEALAHLVMAGADAFLMPSRFEPCGMTQMYSQRYGTPPIVHATGGLVDSVADAGGPGDSDGTGFVFAPATADALLAAVARAAARWRDRAAWRTLQRNGMARSFGWRVAARQYAEIYRRLAQRR